MKEVTLRLRVKDFGAFRDSGLLSMMDTKLQNIGYNKTPETKSNGIDHKGPRDMKEQAKDIMVHYGNVEEVIIS
jgi:hypothetical protein